MTRFVINVVAPVAVLISMIALTALVIMDTRWAYVAVPLGFGFFSLSTSYGYKGTPWSQACKTCGHVIIILAFMSFMAALANGVFR